MSNQLNEILEQMHYSLGAELLKRIQEGTATAAELSVARQFLNDNHISGVPKANNPLGQLAQKLPSFEDTDKHLYKN